MPKKNSLSQLILDDANANKGTKRGRQALEQSLRELGAGRSILLDKHNRIMAGNKTVDAARALKLNKLRIVDVDGDTLVAVRRTDLDLKRDAKAKKLAIADNRIAELDLAWDPETLAAISGKVDLSQFWSEEELRNALGKFGPSAEEQSRLDVKVQVECPNCGHKFERK